MAALICAAMVGCGAETEGGLDLEEPGLSPEGGGYRPPPAGANGLLPSCFWAAGAQTALRGLGGAALDQGGAVLPSVPLALVPEACRDVLRDAVECALPLGQILTDPETGDAYGGRWGLAPGWANAALGTAARRYVTGCLLQRLNAFGDEVPILLEGPDPAIARDPDLAPLYPVLESTVFGDLFSSTTPVGGLLPPFAAYVCWEGLLPRSCGFLGLPLLGQRICDTVPVCGLIPIGPCGLACAPNEPYWKCKPSWLSPWWTETVRVRLETESCQ